jgi:hypothetical protein
MTGIVWSACIMPLGWSFWQSGQRWSLQGLPVAGLMPSRTYALAIEAYFCGHWARRRADMMKDRILAAVQSPPLKGFSGFGFRGFAEDLVIVGAEVFAKAVPWGVAFTVHLNAVWSFIS